MATVEDLFGHCRTGRFVSLQRALQCGADPGVRDASGATLLHVAAELGTLPIVRYLVKENLVQLSTKGRRGWFPIHSACVGGSIPVVRYLLSCGADINVEDDEGVLPIHYVAYEGHVELFEFLQQQFPAIQHQKSKSGKQPIHHACMKGRTAMLEYLMSKGVDINTRSDDGVQALHLACYFGQFKTVKALIQGRARTRDKDEQGKQAIHWCAMGGCLDVLLCLLDQGCSIDESDSEGRFPLHLASEHGHLDLVNHLLMSGADPNLRNTDDKYSYTPLVQAVSTGQLDIAELLLKNGAGINVCPGDLPPVHMAAAKGHLSLVQYLIKHGADIHAEVDDGFRAIHFACSAAEGGAQVACIKTLLANGAKLKDATPGGILPIHAASMGKSAAVLQLMLTLGRKTKDTEDPRLNVGVDCADGRGETALHHACRKGRVTGVKLLLSNDARTDLKNKSGQPPIDLARKYQHIGIVELLEGHTGRPPNVTTKGKSIISEAAKRQDQRGQSQKDIIDKLKRLKKLY